MLGSGVWVCGRHIVVVLVVGFVVVVVPRLKWDSDDGCAHALKGGISYTCIPAYTDFIDQLPSA